MVATVRVMSAEEIAARPGGEAPFLRLPEPGGVVFAERRMRLLQRAAGHPMQDYLRFVAAVAAAQRDALAGHPPVPVPDGDALDRAARAGVPPLQADDWARDPAWRGVARAIATAVAAEAPPAARPVLQRVAGADDAWLEQQADALVGGTATGLDLAAAPLVAAGLQVHFQHLVLETARQHRAGGDPFGRLAEPGRCPCCGSLPVAGITRDVAGAAGQRYLHCALCDSEWHHVRGQCTRCGSRQGMAYQALESADGEADPARAAQAAVQAETCEACGHYLKLMHSDRDPFVEPLADDLASLTLDLLVADAGLQRHGVNLMLLFGDPDATPPPDPPGDP